MGGTTLRVEVENTSGAIEAKTIGIAVFKNFEISRIQLKRTWWDCEWGKKWGNPWYKYQETFSVGVNNSAITKDNSTSNEDIVAVFYLEKIGGGYQKVGEKKLSDITGTNYAVTVYDSGCGGTRHGGDYKDNLRIEFFYNDKKIYEVRNIIGFATEKDGGLVIKNISGEVFYENY